MSQSAMRLYRFAEYSQLTQNPGALRTLSCFKLSLPVFEAGKNGAAVVVKGTDIDPTEKRYQFLLEGSILTQRLIDEAGARLHRLPDGALLEVGGIKLKLQHFEEVYIAAEVFADGVYNLRLQGDFILVDIGMNVGTTSLFYAKQPKCRKVYAFEPFPGTVERARVNFALNPMLAEKIELKEYGLAARTFETELEYVPEHKGSISMYGLPNFITAQEKRTAKKVPVSFVAASEAILEIAEKHPETPLVCKVDCEGAEYEILESLAASDALNRIDYFLIEWHVKGAALLERHLEENGFKALSLSPNRKTLGMLYAWRERK